MEEDHPEQSWKAIVDLDLIPPAAISIIDQLFAFGLDSLLLQKIFRYNHRPENDLERIKTEVISIGIQCGNELDYEESHLQPCSGLIIYST